MATNATPWLLPSKDGTKKLLRLLGHGARPHRWYSKRCGQTASVGQTGAIPSQRSTSLRPGPLVGISDFLSIHFSCTSVETLLEAFDTVWAHLQLDMDTSTSSAVPPLMTTADHGLFQRSTNSLPSFAPTHVPTHERTLRNRGSGLLMSASNLGHASKRSLRSDAGEVGRRVEKSIH